MTELSNLVSEEARARNEKVLTHFTKMKFMNAQPLHPKTKRKRNNRLKRNNFITFGHQLENTYDVMPEQAITAIQAPYVKQPLWMNQQKLTINRGKANLGRKDENSKKEAMCMINQLYPNKRWIRVYIRTDRYMEP